MIAADVVSLYRTLEERSILIWIDGGWAVDALIGEQTRPHQDLDIVVQQRDLPVLRQYLETVRFGDIPRDDTRPWNFVVGDDTGRLVDVHAVVFDKAGNGLYGPPEGGVMYPAGSLAGIGSIGGQPVRCVALEYAVEFRTGYELRPRDCADLESLRSRLDIVLPDEYADWCR